jgi:hypothetical protein
MATTPGESAPAATPSAPAKKGVKRSTDITLSIVFLAVQFVFVVVFFFVTWLGLALAGGKGSLSEVAEPIMLFGPGIIFIANLIVSVVLMNKGRTAWIATLVGFIVAPLTSVLGNALLQAG